MGQLLNLLQGTHFLYNSRFYDPPTGSLMLLQHRSCPYYRNYTEFKGCRCLRSSLKGSWEMIDSAEKGSLQSEAKVCDGRKLDAIPHIQTLRKFPKEELYGKVVMVRFDSTLLLQEELDPTIQLFNNSVFTIQYLYHAGAKVILVSDWSKFNNSKLLSAESVADYLASVLQLKVVPENCISGYMQSKIEKLEKADILLLDNLSKFVEERANCSVFSEKLASGVDVFVNDAFAQSHKILASTVGVTRFCYACVAGFQFEDDLSQVKEVTETNKQPYIAIIGGGHLSDKAAALHFLASKCDGLVFVGMMAFQIMHALGRPVPLSLVEHGAMEDSLNIIQIARYRNIPVLFPKDFWCMNRRLPEQLVIFPAHGILDGWSPIDLGPNSLDEISSLLSKCKKILWIGPVKFRLSSQNTNEASKLAMKLEKLSQNGCDITVVGNAACKAFVGAASSVSVYNMVENASVVWEFLKGRKLPGLTALDRAYPFAVDWEAIFSDPAQPLVVDIGSGNGLFLLGMARRQKVQNFLGLEINEKLVRRCLDSIHRFGLKNGYFIATNATSTFRSIVSSYPGELVLVSIQCPNPDFDEPEHRWRMLQRSLVEAITDLLTSDGKVFLQSDIEAVAVRMKEQFMMYGKGKLAVVDDEDDCKIGRGRWLNENPFGIRSDWEQHVINRGDPMYRLMISKVDQC